MCWWQIDRCERSEIDAAGRSETNRISNIRPVVRGAQARPNGDIQRVGLAEVRDLCFELFDDAGQVTPCLLDGHARFQSRRARQK